MPSVSAAVARMEGTKVPFHTLQAARKVPGGKMASGRAVGLTHCLSAAGDVRSLQITSQITMHTMENFDALLANLEVHRSTARSANTVLGHFR